MGRWSAAVLLTVALVAMFLGEYRCLSKLTQLDIHTHMDDPIQVLETESSKSADLLMWDLNQYNYFIVNSTRQFGVVVLITAKAEGYRCDMCGPIESDMAIVAKHYAQHRDSMRDHVPLYFVVLDADRIREFFVKHKIGHVPLVGYFYPKDSNIATTSSFHLRYFNFYHTFGAVVYRSSPFSSTIETMLGPSSILDYCNKMHQAQIPRMASLRRTFTASSVIALSFATCAHYTHRNLDAIVAVLRSRWLWCGVSLGVYAFSIGGGVSMMMTKMSSTSLKWVEPARPLVVHPTLDHDMALEGLVVTTCCCAAAWVYLVLLRRNATPPRDTAPSTKSRLRPFHHAVQNSMLLAQLLYACALVLSLAAFKTDAYSVWATLPSCIQQSLERLHHSKLTNWVPRVANRLYLWVATGR